MSQKKRKLKKGQKKTLGKIFLKVMLVTFIILALIIGGLVFAYNHFIYKGNFIGGESKKELDPINKTLAVFGVDEDGYRTDVIFVLNYNSETGKTRIISIPRDTKVEWSDSQRTKMEELKGYSMSVSKINEMTSYVGIEHIRDFTIDEIENLLGMEVDNYVIITIDAFKQIVDAIGGVEVDVPVLNGDGLHYDDNAAGLHIHLDPGVQVLDGEAAEGLVRFRKGYAEGDVGRIKTQQLFLEALAKKATSPEIITKLPAIINTVLQTVSTDVKLTDVPSYRPYLKGLDANSVSFDIIPGEAAYEGGKSYFIADEAALPEFVKQVFMDSEPEEVVEDKTVSIEILNATGVRGAAATAKEELVAAGYEVQAIGNATLEDPNTTVIYAKDIAKAAQFKAFYSNALIKANETIGYDIQIILGNDIE